MAHVDVNLGEVVPAIAAQPPKEMISVTKLDDGRTKVRINSSSVSVIQECPRKANLLLHSRWRAEYESPATIFGSAVHKALEIFYSGPVEERILPKIEDCELLAYGHGVPDGLVTRALAGFIEKAQALSALPETDKRSIQNGVWILYHYFKTFIDDPYVAIVDEQGPFVERKFSVAIHDCADLVVEYFGTIDLGVRHIHTGEVLVADHKTSSVVGNDFYNRLKPNHQYTGYLYGAREVFGLPTFGFLVNCLQVKEKPKTSRGSLPHYPRQITTRDVFDFDEFKEAVVRAAKDYVNMLETNSWPIGPVNSCTMYGGCTFLSVCSAPKSMRENILSAKFTKGTPS